MTTGKKLLQNCEEGIDNRANRIPPWPLLTRTIAPAHSTPRPADPAPAGTPAPARPHPHPSGRLGGVLPGGRMDGLGHHPPSNPQQSAPKPLIQLDSEGMRHPHPSTRGLRLQPVALSGNSSVEWVPMPHGVGKVGYYLGRWLFLVFNRGGKPSRNPKSGFHRT
jgi:hypothetical protein